MAFICRALILIVAVAGVVLPVRSEVLINEIMYHPASTNPREEYIELFNTSSNDVNLTNWRITRGTEFTFATNTIIRAGGYLVVAANRATFQGLYPTVTNVVGDYLQIVVHGYPDRNLTNFNNTLGNSGNTLELHDATGDEVDHVEYANEGDWASRRRGPNDVGIRGWICSTSSLGFPVMIVQVRIHSSV